MVAYTEAVREAVGPELDLMIDVVNRLLPAEAIGAGRALEPYGLFFFEDPIEPDNIDAMAYVANSIPIPVASGERLYTIYQFRDLLNKNGSAYIRPDISLAGGITNLKKIAALAEASYVGMVPHNPCSPVMTASCVQLDAAIHNVAIQEYTGTEFVAPKRDLVKEPLKLEDGHLIVPDTPGIGVELNEEAFKHYPPQRHVRPPVITSDGGAAGLLGNRCASRFGTTRRLSVKRVERWGISGFRTAKECCSSAIASPTAGGENRAVPLGDGYVSIFTELATARYPERNIEWVNMGIGGNRTTHLRERWQTDVIDQRPDRLSIKIGINDLNSFRRRDPDGVGPDQVRAELR